MSKKPSGYGVAGCMVYWIDKTDRTDDEQNPFVDLWQYLLINIFLGS